MQEPTPEPTSLAEALPAEQKRVRELRDVYLELPNGAGAMAAMLMSNALTQAEAAAMSGDVLRMIRAYQSLRRFKS